LRISYFRFIFLIAVPAAPLPLPAAAAVDTHAAGLDSALAITLGVAAIVDRSLSDKGRPALCDGRLQLGVLFSRDDIIGLCLDLGLDVGNTVCLVHLVGLGVLVKGPQESLVVQCVDGQHLCDRGHHRQAEEGEAAIGCHFGQANQTPPTRSNYRDKAAVVAVMLIVFRHGTGKEVRKCYQFF
jgi:hypothetical protein